MKFASKIDVYVGVAAFVIISVGINTYLYIQLQSVRRERTKAQENITRYQDGWHNSQELLDKTIFGFTQNLEKLSSYSKNGVSVPYEYFDDKNLNQDTQLSLINEELGKINQTLILAYKRNNIIVAGTKSLKQLSTTNPKLDMQLFTISSDRPDPAAGSFERNPSPQKIVFTTQDLIHSTFAPFPYPINGIKVLDWLSNGDIIYAVFAQIHPGLSGGAAFVYQTNDQIDQPKFSKFVNNLIEFCRYGISPGTSQRELTSCARFNFSKTSGFINQEDLP